MPRILFALAALLGCTVASAATIQPRADARFADSSTAEVPSLQRHVLPLMGRLGCNGRACHGSFQGQGGFRLSLFGYDFKADHDALSTGKLPDGTLPKDAEPRIDLKNARASLILVKPTSVDKDDHGGGKRMDVDSWQYRLILRWIEAGAPLVDESRDPHFVRLEVTPTEMVFAKSGETSQLKAVSYWSDGTAEDVTPLCRFQSNDDAVAKVSEAGLVTVVGKGDTHIVVFYDNGVVPTPVLLPLTDAVGPKYPPVPTPTRIDELVVNKLRKLGIVPSELSSDSEFLRRVSLDITGTLPSPDEIRAFLADGSTNKRDRKIDELLSRPAYAAWWATKFCDVTGNNERSMPEQEFRATYYDQWYRWVNKRLAENMPYDKLVEGMVLATSKLPGESYEQYTNEMTSYLRKKDPQDFAQRETMPHYWSRNNMRTANEKALSFSYAFLGVRLQCAECHKHPFDQWSQEDFKHFTAFFNRVNFGLSPEDKLVERKMAEALGLQDLKGNELRKAVGKLAAEGKPVPLRELYVSDQRKMTEGRGKDKKRVDSTRVITPKVLGGEESIASNYSDPRQPLMDWLRQDDNPYFARAVVNRVWAGYFNVGIVNPPDDMNLANPPSNRELIDFLAAEFIQHGYDLKWLHREICRSRTYQLSWKPNATNDLDARNFSHAIPRRLPAEVAYDAVVSATGGKSQLELRDKDPVALRAIGSLRGYTQGNGRNRTGYALQVFGKPMRETTCDCERSNDPTLLQTIFLRNDDEVLTFIDRAGGWLAEVTGQQPPKGVSSPDMTDKSAEGSFPEIDEKLARQLADLQRQLDKAKKKDDQATVRRVSSKIQKAREYAKTERAKEARRTEERRNERTSATGKDGDKSVDLAKIALVVADEDRSANRICER
jgi:hypothetical protein